MTKGKIHRTVSVYIVWSAVVLNHYDTHYHTWHNLIFSLERHKETNCADQWHTSSGWSDKTVHIFLSLGCFSDAILMLILFFGSSAMWESAVLQVFQRNLLPQSSGLNCWVRTRVRFKVEQLGRSLWGPPKNRNSVHRFYWDIYFSKIMKS